MAYILKADLEKYLGLTIDDSLDAFIVSLISACEKYIENKTGTKFEAPDPDSDVTRYYNGNDCTRILIDDLREITSLSVDGIALVNDEDFYLLPLNAVADEKPFNTIELIQPETRINRSSRIDVSSPYVFDKAQKNIVLIGKFGYSETPPDDIKFACLKLAGGIIKENLGDQSVREISSETLGDYSVSFAQISSSAHRLNVSDMLADYVSPLIKRKGGAKAFMSQVS